jgi:hydrogenase maturation factor HypE
MLMAVKDPEKALDELKAAGIEAHLIGRIVKEGSVLREEGQRLVVDPPARDEIYKLYDVEEGSEYILPEKKEKPCE